MAGKVHLRASVQRNCSSSHSWNLLELGFDPGFLTLRTVLFYLQEPRHGSNLSVHRQMNG